MSCIKLASINIEKSSHLERVRAFLNSEMPDVVCLQECMHADVPWLEQVYGAYVAYAVMSDILDQKDKKGGVIGVAIASRFPLNSVRMDYYEGVPGSGRVLLSAEVMVEGVLFRIATTHFTWSPRGEATDAQRRDMASLLKKAAQLGQLILTGDFNVPRGGELFAELEKRYKDNIPLQYATSLDLNLHRASTTRPHEIADKMVDGLFTTSDYKASKVKLHDGVSDHCAVTGLIRCASAIKT